MVLHGDDASSRLAPGFISKFNNMETPSIPKGASPFRTWGEGG